MPGEALGIIRIQAAKRPSCRVEPTVVRAIVIPGRRILMDHRILLAGLCRHKDPSAITTRAPCTVQDPFRFFGFEIFGPGANYHRSPCCHALWGGAAKRSEISERILNRSTTPSRMDREWQRRDQRTTYLVHCRASATGRRNSGKYRKAIRHADSAAFT
jgi:hypothetical protein